MLAAVDQIAKGATSIMHEVALLRAENLALCKANEGLSKRRKAKRTRVQHKGSLSIQEARDLLDQKDAEEQMLQEDRQGGSSSKGSRTKARCCSKCGKPGHNARTCQRGVEASDQPNSSVAIVDK